MPHELHLSLLREHLVVLSAPGSDAELRMAYWCSCIGGHALRLPAFTKLGLRWDRAAITFGPDTYFDALGRFFELDPVEVDYLFGDHPTATKFDRIATFADAILRIDDLLLGVLNETQD